MGSTARRGGSSGRTGRSAFPDRRGADISGNNNGGKLTVSGVVNESDNVAGWYLGEGGALANSVMIDGSSVRPAENEAGEELAAPLIVGGGSADGDASDNRVTVTGGDMNLPDDLPGHLGDMSDISGTVNAQAAMLVGGMAEKGTASGNSVAVDDHSAAAAEQIIVGGAGWIGASGNGAAVNDHSMAAAEMMIGGMAMTGDASDNEVTVSGSSAALTGMMAGGMAAGGAAAAESRASGNRLGVYDRSLAMSAMMAGGMARIGEASDNEMTVSGGSAAAGISGAGLMAGGMSGFSSPDDIVEGAEGNVSGNRLGVYDSSVIMTGIAGGMAVNGDASGNTVIITDGTTVGGEAVIVGGVVGVTADESGQAEAAGAARDNTVILAGEADVSGAELYGWRAEDGTTEVQETSGNTLVIDNWSGSVKKAQNFDAVRFDSVTWEDGGTVLEATDGEDAMLADAEILADDLVIRGENTPQAGERMTFIKGTEASAGEQEGPLSFTKGTVTRGTAVMEQETADSLDYVIQTVGLNPQTAAVNRGRLTGAAFVNQGADIAADAVSLLDDGYHWGTRTFGAVYGSRSEYDDGVPSASTDGTPSSARETSMRSKTAVWRGASSTKTARAIIIRGTCSITRYSAATGVCSTTAAARRCA